MIGSFPNYAYFTAPLVWIVEGKLHGVDIDPAMIEQIRAELEHAETTVLDLICTDARDLPQLLPEKVDYVRIANTVRGTSPARANLVWQRHRNRWPRSFSLLQSVALI
jgi:ubiquinone/menaquinone biosynthesis C-methylase UbiE